jgi:predicted nuclease with TOPRIM domain
MAAKIETVNEGTLITFSGDKQLEANATRLKVFVQGEEGQRDLDIVKHVSANQVLVKGELPAGKQLFVYGEEVNDVRAVDYEALSVLNISATQELAKQLAAQNDEIKELKASVDELKKESARLDAANKSFAATYAQLDARVNELQKMVEKNKK